jgi:hypothetical protein
VALANWGSCLYYVNHRLRGALLFACGSVFIFSTLTSVAFGDALFWRAEWRALSGKNPYRQCSEYCGKREYFPHDTKIVPHKYIDSM